MESRTVGDGDISAAPMADINVTPLIDVMLVLLIIFMISVPISMSRIQIDLPAADPKPIEDLRGETYTLRIHNDNSLTWNDEPMTMPQLDYQLRTIARDQPPSEIRISTGDLARYQVFTEVMMRVKNQDIRRIAVDGT